MDNINRDEGKTLVEWYNHEVKLLNEFLSYWKNWQDLNPEDFPDKMQEGDWSEQFLNFINSQDEQQH